MGGKTSTASKNKYNEKAYDRVALVVPKGEKETIREHAALCGESINGFICRAIRETMERDVPATLQLVAGDGETDGE